MQDVWAARLIRAVMQLPVRKATMGEIAVTFRHLPDEAYICDPSSRLQSGDTVVLLAENKACDMGVIETKSFPVSKTFRVQFLHDPDARGSPRSMLFETKELNKAGIYDDGTWMLVKVVTVMRSI